LLRHDSQGSTFAFIKAGAYKSQYSKNFSVSLMISPEFQVERSLQAYRLDLARTQ
jgi:hypothetical protein